MKIHYNFKIELLGHFNITNIFCCQFNDDFNQNLKSCNKFTVIIFINQKNENIKPLNFNFNFL